MRARTPSLTLLLVALFWAGGFWAFTRVLGYFQAFADFGPLLTQRLLVLLFVSLGAVLLVSNTVTALGTFYLADDVAPLLAAPVPARRLHHARFVETLVVVVVDGADRRACPCWRHTAPSTTPGCSTTRARSRCSCPSSSSRPPSAS